MSLKVVELTHQGITDLEPVIGQLPQLKSATKISLKGNKLRTLPENLAIFKECTHLDLSDNPISSIKLILKGIASIPKLISLNVDFPNKSRDRDIGLVLSAVPTLRLLNGIRITSGSKQTTTLIPSAFMNPVGGPGHSRTKSSAGSGVGTGTGASVLSSAGQSEHKAFESVGKAHRYLINEEDIKNYNVFVDCFKLLHEEVAPESSSALGEEMNAYFAEKLRDLAKLDSSKLPGKAVEMMNLRSLFKVYLFGLGKLIKYLHTHVDSKVAYICQFIHNTFSDVIEGFSDLALTDLANLLPHEGSHLGTKGQGSTNDLSFAPNLKLLGFGADKQQYMSQQHKIGSSSKLVPQETSDNSGFVEPSVSNTSPVEPLSMMTGSQQDESGIHGNRLGEMEQLRYEGRGLAGSHSRSGGHGRSMTASSLQAGRSPISGSKVSPEGTGYSSLGRNNGLVVIPKKLTIIQVEEMVNELVESKLQSDVAHLLNRMPRKTMEAHLNEFLLNKFGVKQVVMENIQSFIYHLKMYSAYNAKFRAFSHILRNECDEEFVQALKSIEKTLAFLLKMFINGNNPYLSESKVNSLLKEKLHGKIEETEAVMIVEYLYNKQDAAEITQRLRDYINKQKLAEPEALTRKEMYLLKEDQQIKRLEYKVFNWIVTDYILESHIKFLTPLVKVYRTLDPDNLGIIDERGFRELLDGLNPDGKLVFDVEDILLRIDPYGFNQITFATAACFVSGMIIDEDTQENVLEGLE